MDKMLTFLRNLPFWWRDFLELGVDEKRVVIKRRLRRTQIALLQRFGIQASITPRELIGDHAAVEEAPSHIRRLMEIHIIALGKYNPPKFTGKIDLFRVQTLPLLTYYPQDGGWTNLASGGVEIHRVPGSHHSVMQPPNVYGLAEAMQTSLEKVHASSD